MRFTQHPSNNRVLGAPKDWDQKELPVGALPVTDGLIDGYPCVQSFWVPDAEELAALNAGGMVLLQIIGNSMPPAAVGVVK